MYNYKGCKTGLLVLREIKPRIGKVVIQDKTDDSIQIDSISEIDSISMLIKTIKGNVLMLNEKVYELAIKDSETDLCFSLNYNQYSYNVKHVGKEVMYYNERNRNVARVKNFSPSEQVEIIKKLHEWKEKANNV
jgi:hypothetical protein